MNHPPLRRILAATDLSAPARHAAERAALVASEGGLPLELLHVADLTPLARLRELMAADAGEIRAQVLAAASARLDELGAALQARYAVAATCTVTEGPLLRQIGRRIEGDAGAALLVCGARGQSLLRHLMLGTTAVRLLGRAQHPVLVVKSAPHETYRRVLAAVDFSGAGPRVVAQVRAVAPHAEIVLLHAYEVPFEGSLRYARVDEDTIRRYRVAAQQEAMWRLAALRDEAGLPPASTRLLVEHGDPSLCVTEQEQELDCDLVAVGKQGEGAVEAFLLGSVTRHVLAESQGDVLVSA